MTDPADLERRVAALEEAVERLSRPEPDDALAVRVWRVWPVLLRRYEMQRAANARTRARIP
jgi:hypothetical protein